MNANHIKYDNVEQFNIFINEPDLKSLLFDSLNYPLQTEGWFVSNQQLCNFTVHRDGSVAKMH